MVMLCLFVSSPLQAYPFKLLVIGDSLSEEYRFELIFSAPNSNPTNANTQNWVEMLTELRPAVFSMGKYKNRFPGYLDYRTAGYEYNYGVPSFKAEQWDRILSGEDNDFLEENTRDELTGDLGAVDAVLIFVGGNDLSLADDDTTHDRIRIFIGRIHDYVRANARLDLPIIIATVPDIGATHKERTENSAIADPADAAAARQRVATLNSNIVALGLRPHTYIARIDAVTDRISDQVPFHINGTEFIYPPNNENNPLHIFCKDGFHPATATQALICNEILKAINQFAATPIPLFTNREILTIIDQNPDQPLLDYLGSAPDDGDDLPGLLEFLLNTDPQKPDSGFTFLPAGEVTFTPSPTALRFADLTVLQSETLTDDWITVPDANIQSLPDGSMKILPTTQKLFYKFQGIPKP